MNDYNWHEEAMRQRARAEKAEFQLAQLESANERLLQRVFKLGGQVEDLFFEAQMKEPPEGHINVPLPREDVVHWSKIFLGHGLGPARSRRVAEACRKALKNDSANAPGALEGDDE